jgi:6-hydroxynicotinate reductase
MSGGRGDSSPAADAADGERTGPQKVICNACPVLCQISEGRTGACDRWGNFNGLLTRVDPVVLFTKVAAEAGAIQGFVESEGWDGNPIAEAPLFVSGVGSGTTYPDYKPAPFIVSSVHEGVDMVTVVTEGIFSYCSFKVKIDTDRWLGAEQATVRHRGEAVGHVTTAEYGSQMLSLGGVHHLTGGSKKEGRVTCEMMMDLGNRKPVAVEIDGGAHLIIEAGKAPVVNGVEEQRMRVGCGSATIGIFARQWYGEVDEVVVVDDHMSRHAGVGHQDQRQEVHARTLLSGRQPRDGVGRDRHHRSAVHR